MRRLDGTFEDLRLCQKRFSLCFVRFLFSNLLEYCEKPLSCSDGRFGLEV